VDLVRAARAAERLDVAEVAEDRLLLARRLAVLVGGTCPDPVQEHAAGALSSTTASKRS
jgi:hypothetical protein